MRRQEAEAIEKRSTDLAVEKERRGSRYFFPNYIFVFSFVPTNA